MLLNIAEPGKKIPSINQLAVGIDLGTTNTLVAVWKNGLANCLADINNPKSILIPSIVHFAKDGKVIVGESAKNYILKDAKNTISSVKRFIGRLLNEIQHIENYIYDFQDRKKIFAIRTNQGNKTPTEISAEILTAVKKRVIDHFPDLLSELNPLPAVITVPAYFDEGQRQATKDAAKIANIKILRLLNEPTSAAIAYGINPNLQENKNGIFVIYDLGGGTFDVSVLKISNGLFQVLATAGNTALGGDDFDRGIYCWLQNEFRLPLPSDTKSLELLILAKKAKEQLSFQDRVEINFEQNHKSYQTTLTREIFANLTNELIEKTITSVNKAIRDAKIKKTDITKVLLIGGATKMPIIQSTVANFFGKSKLFIDEKIVNPETAVVYGACRQADILVGNKNNENEHLLLDVLPLSLGIETYGGLSEKIIHRNSTLPIIKTQEFTTHVDGQTAISLHIIQGEREIAKNCRSLAYFELHNLPPMPAGIPRIQVKFRVDADGLLTVEAFEKTSNTKAAIEVKPTYGLDQDEIIKMINESMQKAQSDISARILAEEIVNAKQLIFAVNKALNEDGDLLSEQALVKIKSFVNRLEKIINDSAVINLDEIKAITKNINFETEEFAQLRMNVHLANALKGQKVNEISNNKIPPCAVVEK